MKKRSRWPISLVIVITIIAVSVAIALTQHTAPGELPMQAVSDGSDGAIVAWQNNKGTYVQRIGPSGQLLWEEDGIQVCVNTADIDIFGLPRTHFMLTADSNGGAIVTWEDRRNLTDDRDDPTYYDPLPVYSQRIGASGELLWGDAIITGTTERIIGGSFTQVVPDGTGGAIVAWNDFQPVFRALHDDFLRLQKIDPQGRPLWGDEGVLVVASSPYRPLTAEEIASGIKGTITRSRPTYGGYHKIVSDASGGAIVFWGVEEGMSGLHTTYAQRVDKRGEFVWQDNGVSVYAGDSTLISAISDGAGGAIFVMRGNESGRTLIKRISASGELHSIAIIARLIDPQVIRDGLGGVIYLDIVEQPPYGDPRNRQLSLYVQRRDDKGKKQWMEKPVVTTEIGQHDLQNDITGDGSGGAIIAWRTWQKERTVGGRIFIQKLDAEGNFMWSEAGKELLTAPELKYKGSPSILSDGSGGAIVIAVAGNSALRGEMIYAWRLDAEGEPLWGSGIRIDR